MHKSKSPSIQMISNTKAKDKQFLNLKMDQEHKYEGTQQTLPDNVSNQNTATRRNIISR